MLAGELHVTLDGPTTALHAGEVVLVPADSELRVDAGPAGATAWVTTTPGGADRSTTSGTSSSPAFLSPPAKASRHGRPSPHRLPRHHHPTSSPRTYPRAMARRRTRTTNALLTGRRRCEDQKARCGHEAPHPGPLPPGEVGTTHTVASPNDTVRRPHPAGPGQTATPGSHGRRCQPHGAIGHHNEHAHHHPTRPGRRPRAALVR